MNTARKTQMSPEKIKAIRDAQAREREFELQIQLWEKLDPEHLPDYTDWRKMLTSAKMMIAELAVRAGER